MINQCETEEVDFSLKLLKCCERAYVNSIDSTEIHKFLHSKEILLELAQALTNSKSQSQIKTHYYTNLRNILTRVRKIVYSGIALTIGIVICHLILCKLMSTNPLKRFPSFQERRCLLPSHPLIMEMVRPVANCSICHGTKNPTHLVLELTNIPTKEAFAEIAYSSRPIIIRKGGFRGGMPEFFNFARLKEIFESEVGGVDTVLDECQFLPFRSSFRTLREAFDLIKDTSRWKEPWYIGWSNCHPGVASKLRKLFPRPTFLPEDSESSAIDWIFIGSPGLGAAMHIDYVRRPSWQAQLSGVKTWHLRPPPECEHVCPDHVTFTIYPGDLLFLETNTWYHQTLIEGDNLSISIGSEYD